MHAKSTVAKSSDMLIEIKQEQNSKLLPRPKTSNSVKQWKEGTHSKVL